MLLLKCEKMTQAGPIGGGKAAPQVIVDGSTTDQWFLELPAPETGAVDADYAQEFVPVCLYNDEGSDYTSGKFWVVNLYSVPGSSAVSRFWSDSASDGNTKKVRTYYKVGTAVFVEDVILNGTTPVSGVQNAIRPLYSELLDASTGLPVSNAGNIYHGHGGTTAGDVIGQMPIGYPQIHGDLDFAVSSTQDDTVEVTNPSTNPGLSYSRCNTEATALTVGLIEDTKYRKVWCRHREQPTMPARGIFKIRPVFKGVRV